MSKREVPKLDYASPPPRQPLVLDADTVLGAISTILAFIGALWMLLFALVACVRFLMKIQ